MNAHLQENEDDTNETKVVDDLSTALSSTVSFIETEHAKLRRKQRGIDKKYLKAAIKHGTCEPHFWGKPKNHKGKSDIVRYTNKDIVYIVNKTTKKEITCYARPVLLTPVPLPSAMNVLYQQAVEKVRHDLDCWTSHTVMVIDTSGSMRTSDVWGARNRLKSVWFSVALDFLAERLESGSAKITDVVSIVTMGEYPEILFKEVPNTWFLYNKIVSMYSKYRLLPEGHGYFLPSLETAEELLKRNSNASCAAALLFLSDGAPSDGGDGTAKIISKVESLAKTFGRRLTFTAIGIGDCEEFRTLQNMVDAAKDYGAIAELKLPSMTSSSLGQTFTSVATSLTTTQTEMTDEKTLTQRKVRDVSRESKSKASKIISEVNDDDFWFYGIEDVKRKIYKDYIDGNGKRHEWYETVELQHPEAVFVAMSKGPFGEGAERFAYRFYEVAADRKTILGQPMVAKESRMVLETEDGMTESHARKKFVKTFIKTQQIARRLAVKFNERLKSSRQIHQDTPQIAFLDCSIYELDDEVLGKVSVLVENKLDHNKWYKWNSNNGLVNGVKKSMAPWTKPSFSHQVAGIDEIGQKLGALDLDNIEEGSEEEESDEDELTHNKSSGILFTPSQVAQAFSHFSYLQSGRKRLVCDLQGVFDEGKNLLQFSDPVIHYYNPHNLDLRCVHGRTDRGQNGIQDFFATHICKEQGNLCQVVSRGFRATYRHGQNN
jgi:hypothetical protein